MTVNWCSTKGILVFLVFFSGDLFAFPLKPFVTVVAFDGNDNFFLAYNKFVRHFVVRLLLWLMRSILCGYSAAFFFMVSALVC